MTDFQRHPKSIWLWIALLVTLAWGGLLLFDVWPIVRGPAPWPPEWRWPYIPLGEQHLYRQVVQWGVLVAYLLLMYWRLSRDVFSRRYVWSNLLLAVGFLFLWQLIQTWVREQSLLDTIIFRTYAPTMNGYLLAPAQSENVVYVIHHYAESIPTFFSAKPQTHPPGLFLYFAFSNWLFARLDVFSDWFAPIARTWAIPGRDWPQLSNNLIASAFVSAWLQISLVSLTPIAVYAWAQQISQGNYPKWSLWSAAALPLIPAMSLFVSQWDTVYPLLGLVAWLLAMQGQNLTFDAQKRHRGWLILIIAGLVLCLMSWLSYGLIVVIGMIGFHLGLRAWFAKKRTSKLSGKIILRGFFALGIGVIIPWLLAAWGLQMNFPELLNVSIHRHFEAVTHERSYSLWLWANWLDLALWLGPGIFLLGVVGSTRMWLVCKEKELWKADTAAATVAFWLTVLALNISGISRGEVGRLWIFLMPYVLLFAMFPQWSHRQRTFILSLMALWSWLIGYAISPFIG